MRMPRQNSTPSQSNLDSGQLAVTQHHSLSSGVPKGSLPQIILTQTLDVPSPTIPALVCLSP